MKNRLLAYASTFVTFLIRELGTKIRDVDHIILYGSVAKGEASPESDVDIFVDTRERKLKPVVENLIDRFAESREAALMKIEGVANAISVKVSPLSAWKDLQDSITATGIVLWGKYRTLPPGKKHCLLFSWEKVGKNRGAFLNKVYGFSVRGKKYSGLLQQVGGNKVGKSTVLIPMHEKDKILPLFKKHQVKVQQREVVLIE